MGPDVRILSSGIYRLVAPLLKRGRIHRRLPRAFLADGAFGVFNGG
jgi:hypothetical protein